MRHQAMIRPATSYDRDAILALVRAAFTGDGHDAQQEVDIVEATWKATRMSSRFELVADLDGAVIGHVLAAPGVLGDRAVLGIAPLCVAPTSQRSGIGSA